MRRTSLCVGACDTLRKISFRHKMKVFLVIPTIRNLDFLAEWQGQFRDCHLLIVEDRPAKTVKSPSGQFASIHHVDWRDIASEFGVDEWIFSRQNAGIRSFGFWKAYTLGADVILTLDDDCFPAEEQFVEKHLDALAASAPEGWFPTFPHPAYLYTRGFPYAIRGKRRVVVNHGLWSNKMDMDAQTQLTIGDVNIPAYPLLRSFVPRGEYFPMSSMNLAFTREVTPLMYFPLMGYDPLGNAWGFDRFDDIWAGIFTKKVLDHLGWAVANGSPFVEHRKASDPQKNLIKEKSGLAVNEVLWERIAAVELTQKTPAACYREMAERINFPKTDYFDRLRLAMVRWSDLFL